MTLTITGRVHVASRHRPGIYRFRCGIDLEDAGPQLVVHRDNLREVPIGAVCAGCIREG